MGTQDGAYGITTAQVAVGASAVIGITGGPLVNTMMFVQPAVGGTLWSIGASLAVGTAATSGYLMNTIPVAVGGPTKVFFANSSGTTGIIHLMKILNSPSEF